MTRPAGRRPAAPGGAAPPATERLDKWLWHARFFRTRSLATRAVGEGKVRVNGVRTLKAATPVSVGDGLTVVRAREVRVLRILGLAPRRGPAGEAQRLYDDLTEVAPPASPPGLDPPPQIDT